MGSRFAKLLAFLATCGHLSMETDARAAAASPIDLVVAVDADDDDVDGVADGLEALAKVRGKDGQLARADVLALPPLARVGVSVQLSKGADLFRLVDERTYAIQGLKAGRVEGTAIVDHVAKSFTVDVVQYGFRNGTGDDVDPAQAHASIERTPPGRLLGAADASYDDPDALRVHVVQPSPTTPELDVQTYSEAGAAIDRLPRLPLSAVPCRSSEGEGMHCFSSAPLRLVTDETDRQQPLAVGRSLRAELGGALAIVRGGRKMQAIRVQGPRLSPTRTIDRLRATVRPFVVRIAPGGAPALGGNDAGATRVMRSELALASAAWSQCGVSFGVPASIPVHVVDPPPAYLIAFGDDAGLPTSGGDVALRVDGKPINVRLPPQRTPSEAADLVAAAITKAGFRVVVSPNARIAPGASASVDLEVRHASGTFASVDVATLGALPTTDATLAVRIGAVDLSDGLQHFGDVDSVAGTLEERALLKSFDDGDPTTIEVVVIPFFGGGGRIGESFIGIDGSSVRNVVLLDRAGVRARRSSLTLAHELGHVLLDIPGHPDDYGTDTPTSLMDSDAADASAFGPRRLSIAECDRMIREAGPDARVPLLTSWPIAPIRYAPK